MQNEIPTHVLGVACRTTIQTAMNEIGGLWARAAQTGAIGKSELSWAVYRDYEPSDDALAFNVIVGAAASADTEVPDGMVLVEVPEQTWHHAPSDGTIAGVQAAWGTIHQRWPNGGPRAFVADVERWRADATGQILAADVFVGVRQSA